MSRVRFLSSCPAEGGGNIYNWQHYGCGGHFFLTNQARLICENGDADDFIFRMKFDCGERNGRAHELGYEFGCLQGYLACLSHLGKLYNPPGNFIIEVTQVLMQHQNEFSNGYREDNYY